ncbi:phosphonoacetaldehyde hydrolase [Alkalimarinus coralli]|uniref:phosphonoacetaldehyde hydrolase n=1 Tax=Alkalimarinus coralli TaxID=2935863 RepID=UPI00202B1324|nr:phosphonoacetaldehyde hydrolase [Alkalimarinus coralli]
MSTAFQRVFQGQVEAVICDWAGTTYDFGSMAPIRAFQSLFESNGVPITTDEAREPMGTEKREHITQLLAMPRIKKAWLDKHDKEADEQVIDRLYHDFLPLQLDAIRECAQAIPGWLDTVSILKDRGIKIGANTGYNREMLETLSEIARGHGYAPESSVCASEVAKGRPFPHMSLKNALELGVSDVRSCIKVDDTIPGIEEGLAAGMWTVGVAVSGNETGYSMEDWQAIGPVEKQNLRTKAIQRFKANGTHIIIDSVADLALAVDQVNDWLTQGLSPDSDRLMGRVISAES